MRSFSRADLCNLIRHLRKVAREKTRQEVDFYNLSRRRTCQLILAKIQIINTAGDLLWQRPFIHIAFSIWKRR